MTTAQITVLHANSIAESIFTEFKELVAAENLDFRIDSREEDGPFATLEWLIPTAVIVYISKSYFDSVLKEMGKDHYSLLKAGLRTLRAKLLGPAAPPVMVIASRGKALADQPYSLIYSILAEANAGVTFKLLLQREVTADEYDEIISAFLIFVERYHEGKLGPESMERIEQAQVVGRTLLLAFNHDSQSIEPVDPIPR